VKVPGIERWAYVTNGTELYEIIEVTGSTVTLENCRTHYLLNLETFRLGEYPWRIVRAAPQVPEKPPA